MFTDSERAANPKKVRLFLWVELPNLGAPMQEVDEASLRNFVRTQLGRTHQTNYVNAHPKSFYGQGAYNHVTALSYAPPENVDNISNFRVHRKYRRNPEDTDYSILVAADHTS